MSQRLVFFMICHYVASFLKLFWVALPNVYNNHNDIWCALKKVKVNGNQR